MEKIGNKCSEVCKRLTYKVRNEILVPHQTPTSEPAITQSCLQITEMPSIEMTNKIIISNLKKKIETHVIRKLIKQYGKVNIVETFLMDIFGLEINRQLFI